MGAQRRPFKSARCTGCAGAVRRGGARCTRSTGGHGSESPGASWEQRWFDVAVCRQVRGGTCLSFPSSEVGQCSKGWDKGQDSTSHPGKVSIPWTGLSPLG